MEPSGQRNNDRVPVFSLYWMAEGGFSWIYTTQSSDGSLVHLLFTIDPLEMRY